MPDSSTQPPNQATTEFCFVYVTCPNKGVATQIAEKAVAERLAACGNILPQMQSIYEWKGELQRDEECVLILKTRSSLFSSLCQTVKSHHPYDCPCIVTLPISQGNPEFLQWLHEQTT